MSNTLKNYEALIIEIIRQSVRDYRRLQRQLVRREDTLVRGEIIEIEKFFVSQWFCDLSGGVDGQIVLDRLNQGQNMCVKKNNCAYCRRGRRKNGK